MKLIYGISKYTNPNTSKKTHIPNEKGQPICLNSKHPYKQHTYETDEGEAPTCEKCLSMIHKSSNYKDIHSTISKQDKPRRFEYAWTLPKGCKIFTSSAYGKTWEHALQSIKQYHPKRTNIVRKDMIDQSIQEEKEAVRNYNRRADKLESRGNKTDANVLRHIIPDEEEHARELEGHKIEKSYYTGVSHDKHQSIQRQGFIPAVRDTRDDDDPLLSEEDKSKWPKMVFMTTNPKEARNYGEHIYEVDSSKLNKNKLMYGKDLGHPEWITYRGDIPLKHTRLIKDIDSIKEEAEPTKPKTVLQRKILDSVKYFDKDVEKTATLFENKGKYYVEY